MIFLDTGFLVALVAADDQNHSRARETFAPFRRRRLASVLLTTNYVIGESITLLRTRGRRDPRARHSLAVRVGGMLLDGTFGTVHRVTPDEERQALAYMAKHDDQDYSFVDCTSFVVMEALGIREAFAFDRHFAHRFIVRPGPLR